MIFCGDKGVRGRRYQVVLEGFAPRVGVAYQITPQTVVRSAYGIFYDEYFGLMLNRTIQAQPLVSDATLKDRCSCPIRMQAGALVDPVNYQADHELAFRDFGTYAVPAPTLRPGYTQNWNFVLEREVACQPAGCAAHTSDPKAPTC